MADESHLKALKRHVHPRAEWLASRTEEALDPNLLIVDAHHHLFDIPGNRYLFDDFLSDLRSGHKVEATVHVQCRSMYRVDGPEEMKALGETEFVNGVAAQSASGLYGQAKVCAGIVGAIDVLKGSAVERVLDAHIRAAPDRFRGIRPMTAWHESSEIRALDIPPDVLMQAPAREAINAIYKRGLSLDIWVFFTQLDQVQKLCEVFPELPVVVNHCGGPLGIGPYEQIQEAAFGQWSKAIKGVAKFSNVHMKVGGLGMHYTGSDFHRRVSPPSSDDLAERWSPFVETCIDAFGPGRCMFESNFPVDKGTCSYQVLWNAFKKISRRYDDGERRRLFSETAMQFYRLH